MEKYLTPDWHERMYLNNPPMRAEWKEMERTGEAKEFVQGVGEVSRDEWKALMFKLLDRALEKLDIQNQ